MALLARSGPDTPEPAGGRDAPEPARQILAWLEVLTGGRVEGMVELRALGVSRHSTTARHAEHALYAPDEVGLARLAKDARELSRRAEGVYATLNPVMTRVGMGSATDRDIVRRRWLLVDIDPCRPAGTSSTDAERAAAFERARVVRDYLRSEGWPDPVLADSGNGYHLLYQVDLPNDEASRDLVRGTLAYLAARFDSDRAKIDTSVYNASRICKLYGTLARKGEPTAERPHRLARVLELPRPLQAVGVEWLVHLADRANAPPSATANGRREGNGRPKARPRKRGLIARDLGEDPVEAYCAAALQDELDRLARAPQGDRNNQLFRSAAALFGLVATGELGESEVAAALEATARQIGLDEAEVQATLRSARRTGTSTPRDLSAVSKKRSRGKAPMITDPETGASAPADDPHRLARAFLREEHDHDDGPTLRFWNDEWHAWSGRWRPISERELNGRIASWCRAEFDRLEVDTPVSTRLVGNVGLALRGLALVLLALVPEQPAWLDGPGPDPAECLPARNGILHLPTLIEHGPEAPGAVLPVTPRFFASNVLSYPFEADPPPPAAWLGFLADLWGDDPESIRALQQWFGYLLTADTSRQKILLLVGPRRSGKGTITRTLRALVGEANVAAPTLSTLASQFGCQGLIGKTVAVCPESRLSGRSDSQAIVERLLSISGEDPQAVDRKHLTAWHGTLRTRFVLLGNELPRLGDYSGALPGRMIVLKMVRSFFGREDTGLQDRILAELPGILVWAIAGWHDLRQSGRFLQPASGREMLEEFETLTNPVGAFLAESCLVDPNLRVPVKRLYDAWKAWCEANGRDHPGDVQGFSRSLRAVVSTIQVTQPRSSEGRQRVFVGVGLRPEDDDAF